MTNSCVHIGELNFVDERHDKLTINAQEALKERLLSHARERANLDGEHARSPLRIQEYYYEELADFMQSYPSIYIDLILIKLEDN